MTTAVLTLRNSLSDVKLSFKNKDAGNQHYRAADVMNTEQVVNFTIRYRPDVKPGMWVLFNGEKWEISTLGEYAFTKAYLGLKASRAKGVSG